MKSNPVLYCLFVFFFVANLHAQDKAAEAETKRQYETRAKALKKDDWDGRVALAKWCKENKLEAQAKKLLTEVIKAKPEHEEARTLLGYIKVNSAWVLEAEHAKTQESAKEKELREKGYVKLKSGEWVPAADVPYLSKGLVKVGEQWVSKEEKEKIDKGFVLVDGEWISPEEAENVKNGLFKVEGKWVSAEDADNYHSNWETAWKISANNFILQTNLPRVTADWYRKIVDDTYTRLFDIFKTDLKEKPSIYLFAITQDYSNYAAKFADDHSSVWPGCMALGEREPTKPGIAVHEKNFGQYYVSHAVAHVYVDRIAKGALVPEWFVEAVASYVSRFHNEETKKWSIENLTKRGTIDSLKFYTTDFRLSADEDVESQRRLLEVGALAAFCLSGKEESRKKAFLEAAAAVASGSEKKIAKAVDAILSKADAFDKDLKAFIEGN